MFDEVKSLASECLECAKGEYISERLENVIELESKLVGELGAFYLARRHVQELKMRELGETRARLEEKAYLFPALADAAHEALRLGAIHPFGEIGTAEVRHRGRPHERKRTQMTAESLWPGVQRGCLMLCRTTSVPQDERAGPTPTGMVVKKPRSHASVEDENDKLHAKNKPGDKCKTNVSNVRADDSQDMREDRAAEKRFSASTDKDDEARHFQSV